MPDWIVEVGIGETRAVLVELTPYDLTKGRITYRFMPGRERPPGY